MASTRATAPILASASPRNPSVDRLPRSLSDRSLLVACRWKASRRSIGDMPSPSSTTSIRSWPAPCTRTWMWCAPASIAFSISSLATAAGRSTTSPAAMPSATSAGRTAIRDASFLVSGGGMLFLPGVELVQRLAWGEPFEIELLQFGHHGMVQRQAELGARLRPFQRSLALELAEHLSRSNHDLPRQAGKLGHLDPVAAVGASRHHLMEKDDALG